MTDKLYVFYGEHDRVIASVTAHSYQRALEITRIKGVDRETEFEVKDLDDDA